MAGGRHRRVLRRAGCLLAVSALVAGCDWPDHDIVAPRGADISWFTVESAGGSSERCRWYVDGQAEPLLDVTVDGGCGLAAPGDWDGDGRWEPAFVTPDGIVTATQVVVSAPVLPDDIPPTACPDLAPVPVPGDWDAVRGTDLAWFIPAVAEWQVPGQAPVRFGRPADDPARCAAGTDDVPAPADYDGDGLLDIAVYEPDTDDWRNESGRFFGGEPLDYDHPVGLPAPADYDGDGDDTFGLYVPTTRWYVTPSGPITITPGHPGELYPVPADYDGDGADEISLYQDRGAEPGAWFTSSHVASVPSGARPAVLPPWVAVNADRLIAASYAGA